MRFPVRPSWEKHFFKLVTVWIEFVNVSKVNFIAILIIIIKERNIYVSNQIIMLILGFMKKFILVSAYGKNT